VACSFCFAALARPHNTTQKADDAHAPDSICHLPAIASFFAQMVWMSLVHAFLVHAFP
jgi:hypothetical protein